MLSKQVKQRIARNKKRRIQCRTKNGRDLYRLIRACRVRTADWAVKELLRADTFLDTRLAVGKFIDIPPTWKGGFKRGELPIITSRGNLRGEHRSNLAFNTAIEAGIPIRVSMEHDADFIIGIDPAKKDGEFTTIVRGKRRDPNAAAQFDVNMNFEPRGFVKPDGTIEFHSFDIVNKENGDGTEHRS